MAQPRTTWPEPLDLTRPPKPKRRRFKITAVDGEEWLTLRWNRTRSEYGIALWRIRDPLNLLQWLAHLGKKGWPGMTSDEIAAVIEEVARRKGWDLWGRLL